MRRIDLCNGSDATLAAITVATCYFYVLCVVVLKASVAAVVNSNCGFSNPTVRTKFSFLIIAVTHQRLQQQPQAAFILRLAAAQVIGSGHFMWLS